MAHDCEPTGCFRQEQRSRRVRAAPQDNPYIRYIPSITTTSTTTVTTTLPPVALFEVIEIPPDDSYISCPALGTTKPPMYFNAYGGDETYATEDLMVHKFSNDGVFLISPYNNETFEYAEIDILLVGGGGGGGRFNGGGGGGGGQVKKTRLRMQQGGYTIKIGSGGTTGYNGLETTIKEIGIKAIGGGAGGSAFTFNGGKDGGCGGGAGGRSNSNGGKGFNGFDGGSSFGDTGGGGGGGMDSAGNPFDSSSDAGKGGDGILISIDNIEQSYYGGGGAGDSFVGVNVEPSLGGGGGTTFRNGEPNTGGGGAGNGGVGGKGFCAISYVPVTTPAPTTTTTPAPSVPDPVTDFSGFGIFEGITIRWKDPVDVGTSPISKYLFEIYHVDSSDNTPESPVISSDGSVSLEMTNRSMLLLLDSIEIASDAASLVNVDGETFLSFTLTNLSPDINYEIRLYAINSVGLSAPVKIYATPETTITTTTTVDSSFSSFIFDFDGDIENGFLETSSITINAPALEERSLSVKIFAEDGYSFYSNPSILFFEDGEEYIKVDQIQINKEADNSALYITIPFTMPPDPTTRILVFFTVSASETTTTTTTTTVTTLPPICTSLYHTAQLQIKDDGSFEHPNDDQKLVYPLQIFLSEEPFPYEITGATSSSSSLAGSPWVNGIYFELPRSVSSYQEYIDSLLDNHNLSLSYFNASNRIVSFDVSLYRLFYPEPFANRDLSSIVEFTLLPSQTTPASENITFTLTSDYTCSIDNPDENGIGSESISGFTSLIIKENSATLESKFISSHLFRITGSFESNLQAKTFYYMLDYGTRERIVGT